MMILGIVILIFGSVYGSYWLANLTSSKRDKEYHALKEEGQEWVEMVYDLPLYALKVTFLDNTEAITDPIYPTFNVIWNNGVQTLVRRTSKEEAARLYSEVLWGNGVLRIGNRTWTASLIKHIDVVSTEEI